MKKVDLKKIGLLVLLVLFVVACSEVATTQESSSVKSPLPEIQNKGKMSSMTPNAQKSEMEYGTASININTFALDLYAQLKDQSGNLFFSPYSISSALAMTYAGASGNTKTQMAKTLHFKVNKNIHRAFSTLKHSLNEQNEAYQLSIANALWGQKGQAFLIEFVDLSNQYYGATLKSVDFKGATKNARQTINQWVANQTEKQIQELLTPGILSQQTRLILTNAIYFKGDWQFPFEAENTSDLPFKLSTDTQVNVPTMYHEGQFKYMENSELQIVELPYQNNDSQQSLSMLVILPRTIEGLALLEETPVKWLSYLKPQRFKKEKVQVYLPKFKLESAFQLKEALKKLGMSEAFEPEKADFSGFNGKKDLVLSAIVHKAFVEVNEEGTEAGAATGVVVNVRGILPPPIEFRADHPFIFLIKENLSGNILFLGRFIDPNR
jgi:serine protease inhibitor